MAAPTGSIDLDIESRLAAIIDDVDPAPTHPEDNQKSKAEVSDPPEGEAPAQVKTETEPLAADDGEPKGEEAPEVSASEIATGAEQTTDEINTVTELAKMFEVEETELLDHLQVDAGEGETVSLSKVISTYKNAPDAVRRWNELEAERGTFQAEAKQLREQTNDHVRELAAHSQALLEMTNQEFENVNWQQLEVEDPAQFLLLKDKFRERQGAITTAIDKMKAVETDRVAEMEKTTVQNRSAEISALHKAKPEWTDQAVATAAMNETNTFLMDSGFSQEEINGLSDHRYLLIAYDAAQYRKLQKQAPQKLEKLRSLPKTGVLRSTARRDTASAAQKNAQKNMDRLKQSGDERDAARIFEELL